MPRLQGLSQKQLNIIVPIFFVVLASIVFLSLRNQNNLYDDILASSPEDITGVQFYKDYLRDDYGLEKPVTETAEIEELHRQLLSMEKNNVSLKSLDIIKTAKIQLTLGGEDPQNIQLTLYHTVEYGEEIVISMDIIRGNGFFNGGTYTSETFYSWLTDVAATEEYSDIW